MSSDDPYGVILGPSRVDYADGSEDEVLSVIESVGDRSVESPEWAGRIHDWPTRYHFSNLRTNLLRPLTIAPGTRILEIGCGTGPLTRHLGELGAEVLAVDGSLARARAARVRCADLANVRVMCGTIDDVDEADFDIVLVIGVLEYAGAPPQAVRPEDWLSTCVSKLGPDGALVLAIENQLGLKYLIGYDEDHHSVPWVGLTDYEGVVGARTWSRRRLAEIITGVGLPEQRLLLPFPDYKLPNVVVAERAYGRADGPVLVDALVRRPVSDHAGRPHLVVDARAGHRLMLDAGLGTDVANSLMVVASGSRATVEGLVCDGRLAWLSTEGRSPRWRRQRRVEVHGDELVVGEPDAPEAVGFDWLRQVREVERPFVAGAPLDEGLATAFRRGDSEAAAAVLRTWLAALPALPGTDTPNAAHPFAPAPGEPSLPADHLDIKLSNYIDTPDGAAFIDAEWVAVGRVSRDLVIYRALWWTANDLLRELVPLPFSPRMPLSELVVELCGVAGFELVEGLHDRFVDAEAAFQALVNDEDPAVPRAGLLEIGGVTAADIEPKGLPLATYEELVATLRRQVTDLHDLVAEQGVASATGQAERDRQIAELREALRNTERELDALRSTKLFRWAAVPRGAYARLRRR